MVAVMECHSRASADWQGEVSGALEILTNPDSGDDNSWPAAAWEHMVVNSLGNQQATNSGTACCRLLTTVDYFDAAAARHGPVTSACRAHRQAVRSVQEDVQIRCCQEYTSGDWQRCPRHGRQQCKGTGGSSPQTGAWLPCAGLQQTPQRSPAHACARPAGGHVFMLRAPAGLLLCWKT